MPSLQNKRVLVTGGASGIGFATAARFMEEGARVAILDRNEAGCSRSERELPGLALVLPADVSDPGAVEGAFRRLDTAFKGLDVLINNAGFSIRHPFLEITPEEWGRVVATNLTGAFYVAQAAARRMVRDTGGVILNMASTNGLKGYPNYADYNASKAGVIALTRTMALELAPKVRVAAVCPGYVLTPMQQAEYTAEMLAEVEAVIPAARHARPEEIAALFAFLSSDEAAFISGSAIVIDGGETA